MKKLKNKRILITGSEESIPPLRNLLLAEQAEVEELILFRLTPVEELETQTALIEKSLASYTSIIFTSARAVKYFFLHLKNTLPTTIRIACVGEKTALAVSHFGYTPHFIPTRFTAQALAEEMPVSKGEKILIPCSEIADKKLSEKLTQRGALPQVWHVYKNLPLLPDAQTLKNILQVPVYAITFSSGSGIRAFAQGMQEAGLEFPAVEVICIGPETEKVARQLNIAVSAVALPHTAEGICNAILHLASR